MASIGTIEVEAPKLAKGIFVVVKLKGLTAWKIRVKIGLLIIKIGIWITGMKEKVSIEK